jgi:hypothetical protein
VPLEASTKPHVQQKFEIFWTNIASTMACPNFRNGPKNGLGPLGVKMINSFDGSCPHFQEDSNALNYVSFEYNMNKL